MAEGAGRGKAARVAQEVLRRAWMPASYPLALIGCGIASIVSSEAGRYHETQASAWASFTGAFLGGAATLGRRG